MLGFIKGTRGMETRGGLDRGDNEGRVRGYGKREGWYDKTWRNRR